MSLKALLKPSKKSVFIDFVLSSVWVCLLFFVPDLGFQKAFAGFDAARQAAVFALNIIVLAVLFHPGVCGLLFLYGRFSGRNKNPDRLSLYASVLFLTVLNPVSFSVVYSAYTYLNTSVINEPCGLEVTGFPGLSSARDAGLRKGDAITSVDGYRIDTTESLFQALRGKKPGDVVSVRTDRGVFDVGLMENPENHNTVLGVNVKQKYCRR
jgi:membrane-associated protease RseP (regulator of RpoE activity)